MEIWLLSAVIVLGVLQVVQSFKNWSTIDDIQLLQDNIKHLQSLNKVVYNDMTEEYRRLTNAHYYSEDSICVRFRNDAFEHGWEKLYYHELPEKLEELKKLKARLCDNNCNKRPEYTLDGSGSTAIDLSCLEKVTEKDLEKYIGKEHLKKFRKQRKKK